MVRYTIYLEENLRDYRFYLFIFRKFMGYFNKKHSFDRGYINIISKLYNKYNK